MARVYVDHVKCNEESDEVGSDDVYFVVFRGNTRAPFNSNVAVHGPGSNWDDFDTDEEWSKDVAIARFLPESVYVVMLVEEDNDRDVSGDEVLGAWRTATRAVWIPEMFAQHTAANVPPGVSLPEPQRAAAAQKIVETMQGLASIYMNFPKGNDDLIGPAKRLVVQPGQVTPLNFYGDGARYRVWFKVA